MSKSAQLKIGDKVQSKCKVNFGAKGIISSIIGNVNRKKFQCSKPPNEILPLCSGMKDRDCFAAYDCQQGINLCNKLDVHSAVTK